MRPVLVAGVVAPLVVLVLALLAGLALGAFWSAVVLGVGLGALLAVDLWYLDRLTRWADTDLDAQVPEASGAWGVALAALHRRVRSRMRHQRDLATTIERFRSAVEALPEGMVILDAANRIEWANARAQAHLGIDLARDAGAPLLNFARQPEIVRYFEAGDFADAVVVDSLRETDTTLSIQVVPFGIDERLLISRNITQLEVVARMRRDFIANVSHELKTPLTVVAGFLETLQDLELDSAPARALSPADGRAGAEHAASGRRSSHAVGARKRSERPRGECVRRGSAAARGFRRREGAVGRPARRSRSTSARGRRSSAIATSLRARSATSRATRFATRRTAAASGSPGGSTPSAAVNSA